MPIRRSVTISLRPELLAVAERLPASGRFGNLSEVMHTVRRRAEEREQNIEAHHDACPAMTEPIPSDAPNEFVRA